MSAARQISQDVARAALLLSREHLKDDDSARALLSRLPDGYPLISLSTQMFSLPMVAKHLTRLKPDWFNPEQTKPIEKEFVLRHMVLKAEQRAFIEDCILPFAPDYALIKGFALADQFYDQPSMRFARDIDVLVRRHSVNDVVERALAHGYALLDTVDHSKTLSDRQDIRAALRYQMVFNLLSPKGSHIEVHRKVDKEQGIFDERRLLFEAQETTFSGVTFRTLSPIDHFIYVAYHCARHNWSRLHWLADLAAMERSPLLKRGLLMERATQMGMDCLIRETLGYIELSADPDNVDADATGARIFERALEIAQHGESRAVHFANNQAATALPFPHMLSPWLLKKVRIRRFWGRMKPHMSDYHSWPLPDKWQWVYRLAGPTRRILRKGLF